MDEEGGHAPYSERGFREHLKGRIVMVGGVAKQPAILPARGGADHEGSGADEGAHGPVLWGKGSPCPEI